MPQPGKQELKKEPRIDGERVEAGLSNARSRSWHNYPGNAAPREAETSDFSPHQGRPGSFSRQLSSKIPVISAFPPHRPPPHHFLCCQVVHLLVRCSLFVCWLVQTFPQLQLPLLGARPVLTVCYCHQVVLCLLCIHQDLQMLLAADTRVRFSTCPKCHIPAGIFNFK